MPHVKSFRDLLVWQKSMALVQRIYRVTKAFPREEQFSLTAQLRRVSVSIPSNIAEGFGRYSTSDYVRFLRIAIGSLFEVQTPVEIACGLKYLDQTTFNTMDNNCNELERMLAGLIKSLLAKSNSR